MSLAIAPSYLDLFKDRDYEPATEPSQRLWLVSSNAQGYLVGTALDWSSSIDGALKRIRAECSHANWDGEGALPIGEMTLERAARIAKQIFAMLPKGTPVPDLVPEPDGEISIGWIVDDRRMFSFSVGAHDKINFAGQYGDHGGIHGWRPVGTASDEQLVDSLGEIARSIARLFPDIIQRSRPRRVA